MISLPGKWWATFGYRDMLEYEEMISPEELARGGSALTFHGLEPTQGAARSDKQKNLGHWLTNKHRAQWRGLGDTQS